MRNNDPQLSKLIKENSTKSVKNEIKAILGYNYSGSLYGTVKKTLKKIEKLFHGRFPGYRACNTQYHNLEHTLDALLAAVRLLDGHNISKHIVSEKLAEKLLLATLFHDTGYIQEASDTEGTGAKFTNNHVQRSIKFLNEQHKKFGMPLEDLESLTRLIHCTGLGTELKSIPFESYEEKLVGCILGTADLVGQMSNRAYLEKLLFLYYEFKEAKIPGLDTEFDILRKTVDFYYITMERMKTDYLNCYGFAKNHFEKRNNIDRNLYMEAMEKQIEYVQKIIDDSTTNFRYKLKRGDWVHYIQSENIYINKMKFPMNG